MTTVDGIMKSLVKTIKKLDTHQKNMMVMNSRHRQDADRSLKAAQSAEVEAKHAETVRKNLEGLFK